MNRKMQNLFTNFVPEAYYNLFMERRGKDTALYPYTFTEYDDAVLRNVPFCVFDLVPYKVAGQDCQAFEIVYKSVFSKTSFKRIIYS